jgi:cation:H+ antiporter
MNVFDPSENSLLANLALFAASAVIVWLAGTQIARCAKVISERTGAGQALLGAVLLGAVVSLPEMGMAAAAAVRGNADLAVSVLLGGIAMTMVALACADSATPHREPLTTDVIKPVVPLQGIMLVALLAVAAAGMVARDTAVPVIGAGVWTTALLILYGVCVAAIRHFEEERTWVPQDSPPKSGAPAAADDGGQARGIWARLSPERASTSGVVWQTLVTSIVVLAAGVLSASTADALAAQTGLGASFFGFIFGGLVTTLPEFSSMIAASRLRQYEMTFADAFGTNMFSLALLFMVDVLYPGEPVLSQVGDFALFSTMLGIALTAIYLIGIVLRPRRSVLRLGYESIAVLVVSAAGFVILYDLR